jgi:hypothetical protein
VKFTAKDSFVTPPPSASAGAVSNKTTLARVSQKSNPPFDQDIFVRGTELGWAAVPAQQMTETADNKFEVTLPLTTATTGATGEFKIADAAWATANCGANTTSAEIAIGTAYTMACGTNPPNVKLSITADGNYKFAAVVVAVRAAARARADSRTRGSTIRLRSERRCSSAAA